MIARIQSMGVLRNLLQLLALIFAALMPFSGMPGYSDDWDLFFSGVLPASAPIVIIVLMLDVMMTQIWKDGETPERIAELNFIIKAHCIVALVLLIAFLSIFLPVLVR